MCCYVQFFLYTTKNYCDALFFGIKRHLILLIFLIFSFISGNAQYCHDFKAECEYANKIFIENKSKFEENARRCSVSSIFLFSLVAPEISCFNSIRNKIELYSLKVLYVLKGRSYSDFSIGFFQMKPSFVEDIENYISSDIYMKNKYGKILYSNPDDLLSRDDRINRLLSIDWQLEYLSLFCIILEHKFPEVSCMHLEDKLYFYASAYNCGFNNKKVNILRNGEITIFPAYSIKKYKYTDIVKCFYFDSLLSE
jgi:hypothetical protein